MTLKRLIVRIACLGILLSAFWALGGFERPVPAADDYRSVFRVGKAWFITVALFVLGAGLATLGDIFTAVFDVDYSPALLVVVGVILMISGAVWARAIRDTVDLPNDRVEATAGCALIAGFTGRPAVPHPFRSVLS